MLIAKEHHEKSLMDPDLEGTRRCRRYVAELEPVAHCDGNGNGWKHE